MDERRINIYQETLHAEIKRIEIMPNHVYQVLKFIYHDDDGEMIDYIANKIAGEDTPICFDKIIPLGMGFMEATNEQCRDVWGTKWNAYEPVILTKGRWKLLIHFQTAWSIPEPILKKLFEMFPEVGIRYTAADDGGWFAYFMRKGAGGEPETTLWTNENDPEGKIRRAMFESLNHSY